MQAFKIIILSYFLAGLIGFFILTVITGISIHGIPIEAFIRDDLLYTKKSITSLRTNIEEHPILTTLIHMLYGYFVFASSIMIAITTIFLRKPTITVLIQHKLKLQREKEEK